MRRIGLLVLLTFTFSIPARAQETASAGTMYVTMPEAEEIALARSAAPAEVSADADIWVVRDGSYQLAHRGTNGNACVVSRSAGMTEAFLEDSKRHLAPICFDEEGARTILRIEQRRLELRLRGETGPEIEATIAAELGSGKLPTPSRTVLSYMMSSGQRLYHSGRFHENWKPHLMIYMPGLTAADMGLHKNRYSNVRVQAEGKPNALLLVVVPEFVDP